MKPTSLNLSARFLAILCGLFAGGLLLSSCEQQTESEEAAEEIGDAIEDAADEVGDAVD